MQGLVLDAGIGADEGGATSRRVLTVNFAKPMTVTENSNKVSRGLARCALGVRCRALKLALLTGDLALC